MSTRARPNVSAIRPDHGDATTPVATYPAGTRATKLRRNPVEDFATFDRYDGPPVTPA